jgi:hypothetical protein
MARGKHGQQMAQRDASAVADALSQLRHAEQEVRALSGRLAARDAEVDRLKDALIASREKHTLVGTYTEADVARLLADERARHRELIRAGFKMVRKDVAFLPDGRIAEVANAFGCEPSDLLAGVSDPKRAVRRATVKSVRQVEDLRRQARLA